MMLRRLLITLHVVLAVAAVGAGTVLVLDPSGDPLTFDVEWLDGSPFDDYRLPGLFLALVIGSANLTSAASLGLRRPWAPLASFATGLLLLAWIAIQTWIIGYNDWTQIMWAAIFLLVTALALRELRAHQRATAVPSVAAHTPT